MAHSFLPLALIKPTTQTGHRLSPVSTLHPILDRCVGTGRLSRRVGAQLLIEICQVTSLSLTPDSNKRHRSTPISSRCNTTGDRRRRQFGILYLATLHCVGVLGQQHSQ